MATRKKTRRATPTAPASSYRKEKAGSKFCDMPEMAPRVLPADVDPRRAPSRRPRVEGERTGKRASPAGFQRRVKGSSPP